MNIEKYLDDLSMKYEKLNHNPNEDTIKELKKTILSNGNKKISKIQLFGSSVKKTNINEQSSVKLLISIKEKAKGSPEEIINRFINNISAVSQDSIVVNQQFQLSYKGLNFAFVFAQKKDKTFNYHLLKNTTMNKQILTNFDIHSQNVIENNFQKEIILMKLWREKHQLNFPSMYLELVVLQVLKTCKKKNLFSRIIRILDYLRKDFIHDKFYDPSNTNNVLSDELTWDEKLKIQTMARLSLSEEYISDIVS